MEFFYDFDLTIIDCSVTNYFADSPNPLSLSRVNMEATISFVIGEDSMDTYSFSFGDFDVTGPSGCETSYIQTY